MLLISRLAARFPQPAIHQLHEAKRHNRARMAAVL